MRAKYGYQAKDEAELSFPSGAIITVLSKADGFWWRGIYKGKSGLVPVDHVDVLAGSGLYPVPPNLTWQQSEGRESGTIDMASCAVGKSHFYLLILTVLIFHFLEHAVEADRQFVFRIHQAARQAEEKDIRVSASSKEDLSDWYNSLIDCIRMATDKVSHHIFKEIFNNFKNFFISGQSAAVERKRIPYRQRIIESRRLLSSRSIQSGE